MLDFNHSMQSGMPFLLRDTDSDSHEVPSNNDSLSDYPRIMSHALPVWAQVVQLTHSSNSAPSAGALSRLMSSMNKLNAFSVHPLTAGDGSSLEPERWTRLLERAIFTCCQSRMMIILFGPSMNDLDAARRAHARNVVVRSSNAILEQQILLDRENEDGPTGDAWAHFVFTLLHCNIYYAIANIVVLLRLTFAEEVVKAPLELDRDALLATCFRSLAIMERTLAFSPCAIKGHMIFFPLVHGTRERLRLCSELGVYGVDVYSKEAQSVLEVMQTTMQQSLEMGIAAVNEASLSGNPPLLLCEGVGNDSSDQEIVDARVPDITTGNGEGEFGNEAITVGKSAPSIRDILSCLC